MGSRYGWKLDRNNNRLEVWVDGSAVAYFPGRGSDYSPKGKAFYVDMVNGSANYTGLSPDTPKATIATALALCTAENDDYVYVISKGEGTYVEGATIALSTGRTHVIGVGTGPHAYGQLKAVTSANTFTATGKYCEIANFRISGGTTSYGGVLITNATGLYVHHCEFGNKDAGSTPGYGILGSEGMVNAYCTIEDNIFMGSGTTGTSGAIAVTGINTSNSAFRGSVIRNNYFSHLPTSGIASSGWDGVFVIGNRFACVTTVVGNAIKLTNCGGCLIDQNSATYGKSTDTTKYYVDNGSNNSWGWNTVNGILQQC